MLRPLLLVFWDGLPQQDELLCLAEGGTDAVIVVGDLRCERTGFTTCARLEWWNVNEGRAGRQARSVLLGRKF